MNNPTLNWTSPVNYNTKYTLPQTTATLEFAEPPIEFVTQSSQVVRQWLLDKLQEESAEVIQAISKVRRFGEQNHHPDRQTTNLQELVTELEDWLAIVAALEHIKYIDLTKSQTNIHKKLLALIS